MSYPPKQFGFAERAISSMIGYGAKILIVTRSDQEFKSCCEVIGDDERILKVSLRESGRCIMETSQDGFSSVEIRRVIGTVRGRAYDLIVHPDGLKDQHVMMLRNRKTHSGDIPFTMIEAKRSLFAE